MVESPQSTGDLEMSIPKNKIMHFMILFAAKNPVDFTEFLNSFIDEGDEPFSVDDMRYMIGMVHGAYDAMSVTLEREREFVSGILKPMLITPEMGENETGQYL